MSTIIKHSISKPSEFTYWIATENGEFKLLGGVGPNQVCDLKYADVEEYTDEQEWLDALEAYGVDIEELRKN